ncbi:hypothetical protein ACP70R_030318 [Stipagrostis hirtigluma subsp. patula]
MKSKCSSRLPSLQAVYSLLVVFLALIISCSVVGCSPAQMQALIRTEATGAGRRRRREEGRCTTCAPSPSADSPALLRHGRRRRRQLRRTGRSAGAGRRVVGG